MSEEWKGVKSENYRIKDQVVFEVDLEENHPDGTLTPFKASDVQLEVLRLDPFHRLTLKQVGNTKTYQVTLTVPDTLGIYKFRI